jgi:hypothetical protein
MKKIFNTEINCCSHATVRTFILKQNVQFKSHLLPSILPLRQLLYRADYSEQFCFLYSTRRLQNVGSVMVKKLNQKFILHYVAEILKPPSLSPFDGHILRTKDAASTVFSSVFRVRELFWLS